jgi:hypothetical protein
MIEILFGEKIILAHVITQRGNGVIGAHVADRSVA